MKRDIVNLEPGVEQPAPIAPVTEDQRYIGAPVPRGGIERIAIHAHPHVEVVERKLVECPGLTP